MVGSPINGTVTLNGTTIIYKHNGSKAPAGGFTYIVSGGASLSTAPVKIAVTLGNGLQLMSIVEPGLAVGLVVVVILAAMLVRRARLSS